MNGKELFQWHNEQLTNILREYELAENLQLRIDLLNLGEQFTDNILDMYKDIMIDMYKDIMNKAILK